MRQRYGLYMIGSTLIVLVSIASAQSLSPADSLKACQEQLATTTQQLKVVRGAVTKIHLPNVAFQAETLVALDDKLTEALQQQRRDATMISALRKELEALKQPTSTSEDTRGPETPAARE